jgi:acyl transferase domain-containing protein
VSKTEAPYDGSEVAIVGMSGRFPGAPDLETFWRNLREGRESIRFFSREELEKAGERQDRLDDPQYVPARPVLDGVESFDAAFFGMSPREAAVLDPQHRVFLECAWHALEDAGYDPERFRGAVSVYAGASFSNYLIHNLHKNRPVMDAYGDFEATIHNVPDSLATLVGYKLNLRGACCGVQTFCSTSLVAVHTAVQSLLGFECDMALAGGVTVYSPQESGYLFQEGSIVSPDGHCRAFDARAGGTVFGNGVGVVVLRRLGDAMEDGARIDAVVRGTAVNNDGSLKVSFAAPGVAGQAAVVVEALSAAGVDADTIGMVEAHGTGTALGDPAEVAALTKAFRRQSARRGFCALGSVKSNVGHLDAAAGVAGLIKLVLSIQNREVPATLHCERPNPAIDFEASPFYVNTSLREWPRGETPRRGGVSAFGVGGTNAHVVVEEAPAPAARPAARGAQILPLSARTPRALAEAARRLAEHLDAHAELDLADVAFTLQSGRRAFDQRLFVVARSRDEVVRALRSVEESGGARPETRNSPLRAVLGSSSPVVRELPVNAWAALCAEEPVFREAIERCADAAGAPGAALRRALSLGGSDGPAAAVDPGLLDFAVAWGLAAQLRSWGIDFEETLGRGAAALVPACLAGTLDLPSALSRIGSAMPNADSGPSASPRLDVELAASGVRVTGASAPSGDGERRVGVEGLLHLVGTLWLSGVEPRWEALHQGGRRRVRLPGYPFERERHWVDPLEEGPPEPVRDPAQWLYRPTWTAAWPAPEPGALAPTLVFLDEHGLGVAVVERLRAAGVAAATVVRGATFAGDARTGYAIDPSDRDHYRRLFESLRREGVAPRHVLHLWSLDLPLQEAPSEALFRRASDLGFHSVLALVAAEGPRPLTVHVAASGLFEVLGGEALRPESAPLVAAVRVLAQEDPDLRGSVVDLAPPFGKETADALLTLLGQEAPELLLAVRSGRFWAQEFAPVPPAAAERWPLPVRDGGCVLITGGLGDVGFVIGAWLARRGPVRLVLTTRTALPPRAEWPSLLRSPATPSALVLRLRKVLALEGAGAEVLVLPTDVARVEDMTDAVRTARERFGGVDGVVHAAGEMGADTFAPAASLTRDTCDRQFAPKVLGTLALAQALAAERPDFCLLTSSLSTVLGGAGYAGYAGANAFQDAYAAFASRNGLPWVSVDFDHWHFEAREKSELARRAAGAGAALFPEEGLAVVERVLRLRQAPRVVVSTARLAARLEFLSVPAPAPARKAAPVAAEAALRELESVAAAAVVGRANGQRELVAFVAFGAGREATVSELRRELKGRLAAEDVPSAFVVLDALPRTADGEVDRKALLRLAGGDEDAKAGKEPRTPNERLVADLWKEALGVVRVSVDDNFFDLGGHSLLSIRVLGRLEKATGLRLDPREMIFQTLGQLAAVVDDRTRAGATTAVSAAADR